MHSMSHKDSFRRIVWPFAIAETIVWAAMYYSFPALLLTWERDLGWSKTELSGAFTASLVVSAVLAPVSGRLIDRGLGRHVFVGGVILGATLLCLLSRVTALWQFYLVWIGIGICMSGALYEACFAILMRVFGNDAKRAITWVTLVAGFAGTLSFPSAHALVDLAGWRGTVVVFGLAMALFAVPLIWFGCRAAERLADGGAPVASRKTTHALRVVKSITFWTLALAFALLSIDHAMMVTHLLPLLDDRGISANAAVLVASMIGPMQVAGRLAMMAAERRVSTMAITVACFVAMGCAAAALLGAAIVPSLIVVFVILQGAGVGVTSIVRPVLVATMLGRRNFGVVSGLMAVYIVAGSAAGPIIGSLIWETGGYDLMIVFAIALSATGLLLLLAAARSGTRPPGN